MKVLVTGVRGQLGFDIYHTFQATSHEVIGTTRETLDLTDLDSIPLILDSHKPDCIIHCAAYTKVDQAEQEKELCWLVNTEATKVMVDWCQRNQAKLIFFSTDYVFDGTGDQPFDENAPTNPINYYGFTKREAEKYIEKQLDKYTIYRVSWLYGAQGHNFVKTMLKLFETKDTIQVVNDQIGSPTNTKDIAEFIVQTFDENLRGIYHLNNQEYMSWYDFAVMIRDSVKSTCEVKPISSDAFFKGGMAKRPYNSRLGSKKINIESSTIMGTHRKALKHFLKQYFKII